MDPRVLCLQANTYPRMTKLKIIESHPMTRKRPDAPLTAMQKVQLAAAKERLKIDAAKARAVAEVERDSEAKLNQFGREIVSYEDMPELDESDQALLHLEFERIACPHWAVAKYRPGFGPKNKLRKLSRDSWYFYETGQTILRAVFIALKEDRIPNLLEALSSETLDMEEAFNGLSAYLMLEDEAKMEAAVLHRTTVEKLDAKNKVELAKIRKDLDARFSAICKRNEERDNKPA